MHVVRRLRVSLHTCACCVQAYRILACACMLCTGCRVLACVCTFQFHVGEQIQGMGASSQGWQ